MAPIVLEQVDTIGNLAKIDADDPPKETAVVLTSLAGGRPSPKTNLRPGSNNLIGRKQSFFSIKIQFPDILLCSHYPVNSCDCKLGEHPIQTLLICFQGWLSCSYLHLSP